MKHKPDFNHPPSGRKGMEDVSTAKAAAAEQAPDVPVESGTQDPPADPALAVAPDRVLALEAELADQRDKLLRLAAEYDNFRKRAVRERQDAELRGMGVLIRGLLDALDDLGRFAHVDPATVDAATVVQGADMVEKKVFKTLAGHGLEVLNPLGQPFDPAVQEAVATTRAELPEQDHRVAQVYQVGYTFNGQLLRPARVVVTQWHDEP
ncbi:MAG TPA: nucleotide exchange factor GrpE [Gemmatimonadaceae bacterium]|nr:nucleotide exchange factor GrpE [Gemmatimonadaceae bacterium]